MPTISPNDQLICRIYGSTPILSPLSLTYDTHKNNNVHNCPLALRPLSFLVMVNFIIVGSIESSHSSVCVHIMFYTEVL